MAHIISFANQKGGVGKTSLTLHTSGALAESGKKVLIIDMDQQGNLSSVFLDNIYTLSSTISNVLVENGIDIEDVIKKTNFINIDIVPANLTLSDLDARLAGDDDAQFYLLEELRSLESEYDYILIDCPPSLGKATRMSFVASDFIIIPNECQEWAINGSVQITAYIKKIKKRANPKLNFLGFVINKINERRSLEASFKEILREKYQSKVFKTEFRNNVQFAEAVTAKKPITEYLPKSKQAEAYRNFAKEIIKNVQKG